MIAYQFESDEVKLPNERRDSTDNLWCANSTLGPSLSAQCELCRVSPVGCSSSVIELEPVNLNAIVKVLDQHQLLDLLRPAHLLHPLPLGLATVILQYQLDQGQAKTVSPQPTDILLNQHASKAEAIRTSPWLPLLTTSMMLLPLSPQANKNQPIRSVHPYLKSKLGGGPLAYIPLQAPAKVASVSAWIPPPKSSVHLDNLHNIISQCGCQWSLPEEHLKSVGVGLKTTSDPTARVPRLFHPFVEEAYSMLNATPTQTDGYLNLSSSVNTHCTCVKRLTTILSRPCEFDARTSSSTHPQTRRIGFGHNIAESQHPCGIPRSAEHFLSDARQFHSSGMGSRAVPIGTCCSTECKEFAYSLLTAMQWSQLISRYFELVQRFKVS
ncbi:unnamed protein product [Dicrocoelium dendriticum]|nr:unnamed protein product [Dicrocoelium dendriticum]